MSIIFLGGFYPPKLASAIRSNTKAPVGYSNHNFELKVIEGLMANCEAHKLSIVSAPKVFSFPQYYKKPHIHSEQWINEGVRQYSIGFSNVVGVNKISKPLAIYFSISRLIRQMPNGEEIKLIINTPSLPYLIAVKWLKRKWKTRIISCLIVPDLPQFITEMDYVNPTKRYLLNRNDAKAIQLCSLIDGFVLLTEQMKELLPIGNKPYIVMEGLCSNTATAISSVETTKSILYTGTLRKQFGIISLLDAFAAIADEDTELWLCGSGDAEDEIRSRMQTDRRVKFFGLVDSEKAVQLQGEAAILVNPRNNEGDYTKYSFPSKTMEYLLAAKPVVMYRLDGIPTEYDDYLIYAKDNSTEALAQALTYTLNLSAEERTEIGRKGREFVLTNKKATFQVSRILKMMNNELI